MMRSAERGATLGPPCGSESLDVFWVQACIARWIIWKLIRAGGALRAFELHEVQKVFPALAWT